MARHTRSLFALLFGLSAGVLGLTLLAEPVAHAYPQWQFSTGAVRCNQCHYAPAGGGLLTSYGRDAVGDELSTFGGDGTFLHGAMRLPSALSVGGDLRGGFVDNGVQDPNGPTVAVFPMQADISARLGLPGGVSIVAIGGFRGQVRNPDLVVPSDDYQPISTSRFISREHYVKWQPEGVGPYLRAGRFFAPFGLRFAEHLLYLRRDLGFDELQETYNLSGGFVYDDWELHVSLFAPDFVRHDGSTEHGMSAYFEHRLPGDNSSLAGQMRLAATTGVTRFIVGGVGKWYIAQLRTMLLGEVDAVQLLFDDPTVGNRLQALATAGVTVFPVQGVLLTVLGERNQVDVALRDAWTAGTALVSWFPYAHCETQLMGRVQFPTGGEAAKTLFIQLHYFL
jgi:hypothetical protein